VCRGVAARALMQQLRAWNASVQTSCKPPAGSGTPVHPELGRSLCTKAKPAVSARLSLRHSAAARALVAGPPRAAGRPLSARGIRELHKPPAPRRGPAGGAGSAQQQAQGPPSRRRIERPAGGAGSASRAAACRVQAGELREGWLESACWQVPAFTSRCRPMPWHFELLSDHACPGAATGKALQYLSALKAQPSPAPTQQY